MGKHEKTLEAVFAQPTRSNLAWNDIEALLTHLGADISEGRGSRGSVCIFTEFGLSFIAPIREKRPAKGWSNQHGNFSKRPG